MFADTHLRAAQPDIHDAVDLYLRLVALVFSQVYRARPEAVWRTVAPLLLFGDRRELGADQRMPSLAILTPWRIRVGALRRADSESASLRIALLERNEPVELHPGAAVDPQWPRTAEITHRVAEALRAQGLPPAGADLIAYSDLPPGTGVAVDTALHCALATALMAVAQTPVGVQDLLRALGTAGANVGLCAASWMGRLGEALWLPAGPPENSATDVVHLPFDPVAAGLRIVVVVLRRPVHEGQRLPAAAPWTADTGEVQRAHHAAQILLQTPAEKHGSELGALLRDGQVAGLGLREPALADHTAEAAHAAGAFGARSIAADTALLLVPTAALPQVRAAITAQCAARGELPPRFLATAGLAPHA